MILDINEHMEHNTNVGQYTKKMLAKISITTQDTTHNRLWLSGDIHNMFNNVIKD